ncbi:MAG TPA: response regulator transcription factor [Saprospiraceae bacterium]|nr:response regulator transcription factor [Saprospiraceae bacterium]
MKEVISVGILEDLEDVAKTLQELLNEEKDIECLQLYHTAEAAMEGLPKQPVDILIVDIGLPRASGIDAIQNLINFCPAMQFCMFTVYEDDDKIFESLRMGAKGYILKSSSYNTIVSSIRELAEGGSPMSPSIARRIIDAFQKMQKVSYGGILPLTTREIELLENLSQGLLYKEIAIKLSITIGTVKQHIHKIYEKLHVTNRTEAIRRLNNGK